MTTAKMSDYQPVVTQDDLYDFDDVFSSTHGVGDAPVAAFGGSFDSPIAAAIALIDPMSANLREIRFCKYLIKGLSKTEAYIKAFEFNGTEHPRAYFNRAAHAISQRPRVAVKLQEMHEKLVEFEEQDMVDIIAEINADRQLARDLGQPAAALSAVKLKAELLGHKRKDPPVTNNVNLILSEDQKRDMLARIGGHRMIDISPSIEDAEIEE
jgi:hypothetical protein